MKRLDFTTATGVVVPLVALGFALGSMGSVVCCSSVQKPVDTSQQILVEAGQALYHVDHAVAQRTRAVSDESVDRAVAKVRQGQCSPGEAEADCVVRHLHTEMGIWYELTTALEAAHGTLEAWEAANKGWREAGDRPPDWDDTVCVPVGLMVHTIIELLRNSEIDVPEAWMALAGQADRLCLLGVAMSDLVGPRGDDSQ